MAALLTFTMVFSLFAAIPPNVSALDQSKLNESYRSPTAGDYNWKSIWEDITLENFTYDFNSASQLDMTNSYYGSPDIRNNNVSQGANVTLDYYYEYFNPDYWSDPYFNTDQTYRFMFISSNDDITSFTGYSLYNFPYSSSQIIFNYYEWYIIWKSGDTFKSNGRYGYIVLLIERIQYEKSYSITFNFNSGKHPSYNSNVSSASFGGGMFGGDLLSDWINTHMSIDPVRDGYTFNGWGFYWNQPTNLVPQDYILDYEHNIYLYALWLPTDYTITYELDGGTNNPSNPLSYTIEDSFTLQDPTRDGYTFVEWVDENDDPVDPVILAGNTGPKTYKAVWTPDTYNITYYLDGGTNAPANPSTYTIEETPITLASPTKAGYNFLGWTPSDTIPGGSTGDKEFTATWKEAVADEEEYEVSVSGSYAPVTGAGSYVEDYVVTINAGEREGYDFDGWNVISDDPVALTDPDSATTTFIMPATDVDFDAQWKPTVYEITYNLGEDGVNNPANPATYTIESPTIPLGPPTKEGFVFVRWVTNGNEIEEIISGSTGNIVLYAEWEPISTVRAFEVTVNGSYAGAGNTGEGSYAAGEPVTISAGSRSGYTFTGWTVTSGGVELANADSATTSFTMIDGPVTVTANWRYVGGNNDDGGDDNGGGGGGGGGGPTGGTTTTTPIITPTITTPEPTDETGRVVTEELVDEPEPLAPIPMPYPQTTIEGSSLELTDDGNYVEIGLDGTPLGEWHWDEENEEWVFDEYPPPLAALPNTGDSGMPLHISLIYAFLLAGLGLTALTGLRRQHGVHLR